MKILDLNFFTVVVIISSIAVALYPVIHVGVSDLKISEISREVERIEFALEQFFYTEGFEIISPSEVRVKTLVQRYYLKEDPSDRYFILWIDPDPSDGKISAAIVYEGKVDPVLVASKMKKITWYDPGDGRIHEDFRESREMAVLVEVTEN